MRSILLRASIVGLLAVFFSSCILSRLTDRAFVGFTVKRPTYSDRKTTGLVLLPITFAIDIATFPLQLILLAVAGDDFLVGPDLEDREHRPKPDYAQNLEHNPQFQLLTAEQQRQAITDLEALVSAGEIDAQSMLGLTEDGHWVKIALTGEARAQLLQRAKSPPVQQAVAACTP